MATTLSKSIILTVSIFICLTIISNASASPTDDLVNAAKTGDIDRAKHAMQQGADPSVLICEPYGSFLPAVNAKCPKTDQTMHPLIWATYLHSLESSYDSLLMLKLLASSGASSSIFSINSDSQVKLLPDERPGILDNMLKKRPGGAKRAITMVTAGYLPSATVLNGIKSQLSRDQNTIKLLQSKGFNVDNEISLAAEKQDFLDVISNPDVANAATNEEAIKAVKLIECRLYFGKINTINGYQNYIFLHEKDDYCGLVPQAKKEIIALTNAIKERVKQITAFRKSITEGDETNCGPVIEAKGKLVKIAFSVANFGNEHWIRRDQIFPSGYECRFVNGQYQMPN